MASGPDGLTSELIEVHDRIHGALGAAWNAAISLLRDPDDVERYVQCSVVAMFLRDARLHIRKENEVVFASAEQAGTPARVLEELRADHERLNAVMACLPPLLEDRRTLDAAALKVLRLVARFEQHLAHERRVIEAHVAS